MNDVKCELRNRMYLIKRMEVLEKDLEKEVEEEIRTENVAALKLFRELMDKQRQEVEDLKRQVSDENLIIFIDEDTMTPEDFAAEEE